MRNGESVCLTIFFVGIVLFLCFCIIFTFALKHQEVVIDDFEIEEAGDYFQLNINGEEVDTISRKAVEERYGVGKTRFEVVRDDLYLWDYYINSSYKIYLVIGVEE